MKGTSRSPWPAPVSHASLKPFWDGYARYFEFWDESRYYRELVSDTVETADVHPGFSCLDLGCGTGALVTLLAQKGARVTAVDLSTEMLLRARQHVTSKCSPAQIAQVEFRQGDIEEVMNSLSSSSYDLIVASLVVSYLPNYQKVLQEVHRVLKSPGRLVMSNPVPNYKVLTVFTQSFRDVARDIPRLLPAAVNLLRYVLKIRKFGRLGVFHFFTQEETKRVLCDAGFSERGITIRPSFGSQVFLARAEK